MLPCAPLSKLGSFVRTGLPSNVNVAHVTEKLLLNTQVSEDFA